MARFRTPGHRMQKIRQATWCICGRYLGGLGFEDGHLPSGARQAYALHRVVVHNAQR